MLEQQTLSEGDVAADGGPLRDALTIYVDQLDKMFQAESLNGPKTGFVDLDYLLGGLQPAEVIVVSGHPGSGRRALMYGIARNVSSVACGAIPVAVVAIAREPGWIVGRLLSSIGKIDSHGLRRADILDEEWPRLTVAVGELVESPIHIHTPPRLNIVQLRNHLADLKATVPELAVCIVENLPMLEPDSHAEYAPGYVERAMREIRSIAAELKICIMLGTDLTSSRYLDRPNKRSLLSDLHPNNALHLFADCVILLYREDLFNDDSADQGVVEVAVAKNDFGPMGVVRLALDSRCGRLDSLAGSVRSSSPSR